MLIEYGYRIENGQTCADRALGVIVMCFGIAERSHHPVAQVLCDTATEAFDGLRRCAVVASDDLPPLFGIEMAGNFGRADKIAEKYRQMAPLALRRPAKFAVFGNDRRSHACG